MSGGAGRPGGAAQANGVDHGRADQAIRAVYELHGDPALAGERASALAVEQSHELTPRYAPEHTLVSRAEVVSVEVRGDDLALATIDFPAGLIAGEVGQLLISVFGNCALLPGVRLADLDIGADVVAALGGGPKLGLPGLRRLLDAPQRPLLSTALKPVGLSVAELAHLAYEFALGGIDLIKDDQGLGNQHWAPWAERVPAVAAAVARANAESGGHAVYLPSFTPPADQAGARLRLALDAGAGGVLALPGITGIDSLRAVAAATPEDFVIMTHPSFWGGFATSPTSGIAHDLLYGTLLRLAGTDVTVFPNYGGRFSFSREQCLLIAEGARRPLPALAQAFPAPGGGMSLERVPEMIETYGPDTVLLIGGELHRDGAYRKNATRFRALAERAADG